QFGYDPSGNPLEETGGGAYPSMTELKQAMVNDLQTTGGKNISKIKTLAEFLYEDATGKKGTGGSEADVAINVLNEIKNGYDEVTKQSLTAKGGAEFGLQKLEGLKGEAAAITQSSPEAANYKRQTKAFLSLISRGLGEKGVLTDKDLDRIDNALPEF